MPTAVIRVLFDDTGVLPDETYRRGLERLFESGLEIITSERGRNAEGSRQIEIVTGFEDGRSAEDLNAMCTEAFGVRTELGVVTYVSRGTDADAESVLSRFGISGSVRREVDSNDDEIVTVTLSSRSYEQVPESRLHTALEATLNCEVRILTRN